MNGEADRLAALRRQIDGLNGEILDAFLRRMQVSEEIAAVKRTGGTATLCPAREREILDSVAARSGIYADYALPLFEKLMELSRMRQTELNKFAAGKSIALIGMPGAGKTSLGRLLAGYTGLAHIDTDELLTERLGISPAQFIISKGEAAFRKQEAALICELAPRSGQVISTGGGCVLTEAVRGALKANCVCVWVQRPTELLPSNDRPISQAVGISELYAARLPLYRALADISVDNASTLEAAARTVYNILRSRYI